MLIKDICNFLEEKFPKANAEDFDQPRIGLTIGSFNIEVKGVLLALDLNNDVVNDAIEKGCNLIITHHPFIFDPLYKVLFESEKGEIIRKMFENNISTFSMHTNLDVGANGVNDTLAEMLGIENYNVINGEKIKGNYLRYGNIKSMTLKDLAIKVKNDLNLSGVRIYGDSNKIINSIGVVGGSGAHASDIYNALSVGIDCFITGEIKLNIAQFADYHNLSLIEVNHGVEKYALYKVRDLLNDFIKEEVKIIVTEIETDKFKTI